ncbi:hypothetical protein DsansV1_C10g0103041 [Dioscorea sansibarensis]
MDIAWKVAFMIETPGPDLLYFAIDFNVSCFSMFSFIDYVSFWDSRVWIRILVFHC